MSPVTPAMKQRRVGSLSVCLCFTSAQHRGGASHQMQLPGQSLNVVKTYIYRWQDWENIKIFSFTAIKKFIKKGHSDLL